eukprot:comp23806_c1_seq1/m.41411 comp23806_c1_seq1/g.41411  ORF comp23806_c1_seq1/g.41411 comp23806_c1_seq1/m.41411 type:complete len:441 (-) comp23806_c1_seq1:189-1511(-)
MVYTDLNPQAATFQAPYSSRAANTDNAFSPHYFPFAGCDDASPPPLSPLGLAMQQPRHRRRNRACKLDFSEVTDITSFMHVLRLHKYTAGLVRAGVDLPTLLHMHDGDLAGAGVMAQGARTRLMVAVDKFKKTIYCNPAWLVPPASLDALPSRRQYARSADNLPRFDHFQSGNRQRQMHSHSLTRMGSTGSYHNYRNMDSPSLTSLHGTDMPSKGMGAEAWALMDAMRKPTGKTEGPGRIEAEMHRESQRLVDQLVNDMEGLAMAAFAPASPIQNRRGSPQPVRKIVPSHQSPYASPMTSRRIPAIGAQQRLLASSSASAGSSSIASPLLSSPRDTIPPQRSRMGPGNGAGQGWPWVGGDVAASTKYSQAMLANSPSPAHRAHSMAGSMMDMKRAEPKYTREGEEESDVAVWAAENANGKPQPAAAAGSLFSFGAGVFAS